MDAILSDAFMGFLSLLLVPILLLPIFVRLSPQIAQLLDWGDVTIILFFTAEYAAKLYLATDRWAFFRSRWRLLDLAIILLSFASYLPIFGLSGRGSAVLLVRLLRLPRLFAVTGRAAGSRLNRPEETPVATAPEPEVLIQQVDPRHLEAPVELTWNELERHLGTPEEEWIHISNLSEGALLRLSAMLRLPEQHFRLRQLDELWPHVGRVERTMMLFLQTGEIRYPKRSREFFTVARRGGIALLYGPKVISVSPHATDIIPRVSSVVRGGPGTAGNFRLEVVEGLLELTVRDYRALFTEIELEIAGIGRTPRARLPKDFLARIYELHKAIARLSSNIVHFRELVGRLVSGRVRLEGLDESMRERFEALADETSYLSEIAKDAGESVQTIIDVYINQSSFETNRILKILAVITAIAIIPATLGGLLGIDGPYDFVFWQVALVVLVSMLFTTYCFSKLGWLSA